MTERKTIQKRNEVHSGGCQNARALALSILMKILEDSAFSHIALRETLKEQSQMEERDKAFVTRLVEGTLEYVLQLDVILNQYSRTRTEKMKPLIRNLLRMSVYQLLYLSKVPESAAINEAVKLAKKHGFTGLSGFVNGVLRNIAREKETILDRLQDEQKVPGWVRFSLPEWLYCYFCRLYGVEEANRIGAYFLSDDNGSYVRYRDGHTEKVKGNIAATEEFRNGTLTVQDYASQQVGLMASPQKGMYVVDVCAAPGGKSCHIAELLQGSGCVDARDLTEGKVAMIRENAQRMGLKNLKAKVWDAREKDLGLLIQLAEKNSEGQRRIRQRGKADLVIADLPCSGLGIIGKKPDIKLNITMEQILSLQKLQREILEVVVQYVRPGGRLLYSTCTITEEENEQNAQWIEEMFPFRRLREQRFLPGKPSDGFYIVEFERKVEEL